MGADSLGGLDGLCGLCSETAAAPPAEPWLLPRLAVVAALPMLLCLGMAPPCSSLSLSLSLLALMLPVREPAPSETDVC